MPAYLSYLTRRLHATGGTIEISPVATLQEAAALAPIVVNCIGMGARALTSDDTLCPVRGQHLITTNPGISQFTEVDTGDSPDLIAIYPHEDHLVLGGTAEPGRWDWETLPADRCGHPRPLRCPRPPAPCGRDHRAPRGPSPHSQRSLPRRTDGHRPCTAHPQLRPWRSRRQPSLGPRTRGRHLDRRARIAAPAQPRIRPGTPSSGIRRSALDGRRVYGCARCVSARRQASQHGCAVLARAGLTVWNRGSSGSTDRWFRLDPVRYASVTSAMQGRTVTHHDP